MSIEAMKQMAELLAVATFHSPELQAKRTDALVAGLKAIEQAQISLNISEKIIEQERPQNCGTGYCSCIECVMEPEPTAWLVEFENGEQELHFEEQSVGETNTPLYSHPPQQKQISFNISKKIIEKKQCEHPNCDYPCMDLPDCEKAQKQEPVATLSMTTKGLQVTSDYGVIGYGTETDVYTSPPQRQPLTDEQIEREWQFLHDEEGNQPDHHDFARAIEAAHGIKGKV